MGRDQRQQAQEELELELVREVVLARRRIDNAVLAALTLGAELLDHDSERATAMRAARILEQHAVAEDDVTRDPRGALRHDLARDRERARRIGLSRASFGDSEEARRRHKRTALLCEVRADLLEVVRRCRQFHYDNVAFADGIAEGLCAATDKLVVGADMETYRAWQRGMVLKLSEERGDGGVPRVMATVDAGPGRDPLTVEWDSPERRLALVARMARAGISPIVICDRLLADLSVASPLRYSVR
ncbi:hypothetical protein IU501_14345 [Nocardia otitidiscaviarum]|uniref:Uncharacterized protein n=1 Tax=Nocardia otitidiscaviarum TaxID=1823 RepID=A0A378YF65_9NOCA|nr:hypothetical protein [Nocardia otitidiscaviarum]MBF6134172.1 hypothetical protein [Nocardia otitidiscaviarum]SUA75812.1 Uncharacterised protein [Nocardia otitidiscaviarum]